MLQQLSAGRDEVLRICWQVREIVQWRFLHSPPWYCCLQVREIVQWKNPALSALVLLLGAFCALAGEFIVRGNHTVTPLKGERTLLHTCNSASVSDARCPDSWWAELRMSAVRGKTETCSLQMYSTPIGPGSTSSIHVELGACDL